MKTRIKSILMVCIALTSTFFASCTDEALVEVSNNYARKPFELTVSQNAPESRLELGQDGLSTMWEPGDKLVLVDKSRTLAPIYLTCTLEEKSDKATFVSESGVPSGDYYVIYNYNQYLVYGHKPLQTINNINEKNELVLWNELNIAEGSSSATISLKHLYTKIRVVLKNVQSGNTGFTVGMYSSKKGFPVYKQFTDKGLVNAEYGYNPNNMNYSDSYGYFASNRKYHNLPLGRYDYSSYNYDSQTDTYTYDFSKTESHSALVLPADLRGEDVFFYLLRESAESGPTCYEFKKAGIEFKAGTSYKVVLDMNEAVVSTLSSNYVDGTNYYQLNNAADWRHAAYKYECYTYDNNNYNFSKYFNFELANDIDFADEYFFPIQTSKLLGNNHKLSNIKLEWPEEDNVGLIRYEWGSEGSLYNIDNIGTSTTITDLTLEDVTIKGNNFVGAFSGWNIKAENCELIGNSNIQGNGNYVGGIVGCNTLRTSPMHMIDVRVGQSCKISGKNYVGGIVGRYVNNSYQGSDLWSCPSIMLMESCKSEATISATEDYVGGIFGKIGGSVSSSYSDYTDIQFSMEDYTFSLIKCINEGDVTGRHYVGGIGGDFAVTSNNGGSTIDRVVLSQSCSNGDVKGNSNVGGILGRTSASTNICYSTGNVSASTSMVGGIVGYMSTMMYGSRIANCYSLAKLTVGENGHAGGIIGSAGFMTVTNCYYAADPSIYRFGGIVGSSSGAVSIVNCLTTLETLGHNLGNHEYFDGKRDWVDGNNDGIADYDYNGDNVIDNFDLYEYYYNYNDDMTNSIAAVTSILDNISIINGDNAYSPNIWPIETYPWYCVKFASFSADTDSPDYDEDTYQ